MADNVQGPNDEVRVESEALKEYRKPQLVEYGDLRELTLGATGPNGDGGPAGKQNQP